MYYYLVAINKVGLNPLIYSYDKKLENGTFVTLYLKKKLLDGYVLKEVDKPSFNTQDLISDSEFYLPAKYLEIVDFISAYYFAKQGVVTQIFNPFKKGQKSLDLKIVKQNLLSKSQQEALDFINKNEVTLLFGDTGSGKTEIYFALFEQIIERNQTAIFLMPEISLTPQMESRLKNRFGKCVAIWHSKISKSKKEKILNAIYEGEIKIIAGARSSLFLPLLNIGTIVVDEEHDDSYKSSATPRYNARDLAVYIGKKLSLKVVLGSGTPSLNSYSKYPFFRLKGQFFNTQNEYIFLEKDLTKIDSKVFEFLQENHNNKKQSIVFTPTRGNFKYLICRDCGKKHMCPYCSVAMSLHKKSTLLKCHYCDFKTLTPKVCDYCNCKDLSSNRIGTSEIREIIGNSVISKVEQFDKDSSSTIKKITTLLNRFNSHEIDILVGTQMLSKGHDYHNVDLVVVLGIDYLLFSSDFRSEEKCMALLLQIAGRTGRKNSGKVVIQTQNREFFEKYIFDYQKLLDDLKKARVNLYPPFKRLARVLISQSNYDNGNKIMNKAKDLLLRENDIEIVGYGESAINMIANKHRFHILLRSDSATKLLYALSSIKDLDLNIDMDPLDFV